MTRDAECREFANHVLRIHEIWRTEENERKQVSNISVPTPLESTSLGDAKEVVFVGAESRLPTTS
jgi:hypothetical protein